MSEHLDETALDEALTRQVRAEREALTRQVEAERELSTRLDEYMGEWVAVRNHEVVAHANTLEQLLDIIDPKNVDAVFEVSEPVGAAFYRTAAVRRTAIPLGRA
jgi:Family of unknown function (DUF5678)